jgi:dephospho-CoA kinase
MVPAAPAASAAPGWRLGLTGGIGSGKSTVARFWVEAGAVLVDTDVISRQITAPGGAAIPALVQVFGDEVLDAAGALNRDHMRQRVFSDPAAKAQLESVLHPLIGQLARQQAEAAGSQPVLIDVPLLSATSHWRVWVHRVLVVDCEAITQIDRVAQRPGWTPELAQRVVAQQLSRRERRALADAVIHNDGLSLQALRQQVLDLYRLWCGVPLGLSAQATG